MALVARSLWRHSEADVAEGKAFFSQVLDLAPERSYAYQAAVLQLRTVGTSEPTHQTQTKFMTVENNVDHHREIRDAPTVLVTRLLEGFRRLLQ